MSLSVDLSATDHVPEGEPIRGAADALVAQVKTLQTTVQDLSSEWTALPGIYADTDHDDQLYSAFTDPDADVDDVVSMARGLKDAAHTAADEFDAIRTARHRIRTVDLPAAQSRYETACSTSPPEMWPYYRSQEEQPLQRAADRLVTDLTAAESTFEASVATAMGLRPSRSVKASFAYGTHDPAVVEAQEKYDLVMGPNATAEDLAAYYEHLATMTPEQIEALAALFPQMRTAPPPLPTTEEELAAWPGGQEGAAWWRSLDPEQQDALVNSMPGLVGNTEGVPYTDRSAANMRTLLLAENDPALSAGQREDLAGIRRALEDLPPDATPAEVRMLLALRVDEEPVLAATAIGNPDTADHVTFSVPGMGAETSGTQGMMDEAQNLYDQTQDGHAVITWIGYDTPDGAQKAETLGSSQVLGNEIAYGGGISLAHALDGFQETRAHNTEHYHDVLGIESPNIDPRVNVIAHSYGTPTSAYALTMTEHQVDTFTMYGSVGVDGDRVPHASALHVATDAHGNPEVYATNAAQDFVAVPLGQSLSPLSGGDMRISPTDDSFGAKTFSSDGDGSSPGGATTDHGAIVGENSVASDGLGYMETGSQSLNTIAAVVNGQGHTVAQIEQSPWDDRRERATNLVTLPDRVYHTVDASVDVLQEQVGTSIDAGQDRVNALWDAVQASPVNSPADRVLMEGVQVVGNGAVDAAQVIGDGVTDLVQDGAGWVHDTAGDIGAGLLEKGRDFADELEEEGIWGLFT